MVPVPVIVGEVNVLLVNVWVASFCTISVFVIEAIFVAVSALPVKAPVNEVAATVPSTSSFSVG